MICPYGFIKCNKLLFGAVRSPFGANTTGTQFSDNSPRERTREMEKFLSRPVFWIFFDDLSLWIYKM